MKQIFISALIIVLTACSNKTLEEGRYRISGEVTGMKDGEIYMIDKYPDVDTIKVVKGKFRIEKELSGLVGELYILKDPQDFSMENVVTCYVEPKIMTLTIDNSDWTKSKLTGSVTQDEQYKLDAIQEEIRKKYASELDAYEKSNKNYMDARAAGASETETEKLKDEANARHEKLSPYSEELRQASLDFINQNPRSYLSIQSMLYLTGDMKYEEAQEMYEKLADTFKSTELAKRVEAEIENMKKGIPGAAAGDFNTTDINGEPIKLADFKGKYLLVDFWASWCVPCRKGNPHLVEIYRKYHNSGLEILGVADDDSNPDAWKKAVEKDRIGMWHHVLRGFKMNRETGEANRENDISEGYNISSLPTKILVGPDGTVIGRFGSGGEKDEDLDKMLTEIFKE